MKKLLSTLALITLASTAMAQEEININCKPALAGGAAAFLTGSLTVGNPITGSEYLNEVEGKLRVKISIFDRGVEEIILDKNVKFQGGYDAQEQYARIGTKNDGIYVNVNFYDPTLSTLEYDKVQYRMNCVE